MANIPQQVRFANFYLNNSEDGSVDGAGNYAGRLEEFMPAPLMIMTAEHHASTLDAPLLLDMGMEAIVARAIINGYDANLLRAFGLANANAIHCSVKAALEDYNGITKSLEFKMRGNIVSMPFGRIRGRGDVAKTIVQIACSRYQIFIGGTEHVDIDVLNSIRKIGGVDRLEALREAAGI
jgi:P2 family phage contractile tail tube protein